MRNDTATRATPASSLPEAVDRAIFQAELDGLRVREKAHTHEGDAIAAARRRLPMVEVDAHVELIGPNGPLTLLDAFEGRRQLIAYTFMWRAGRPAAEQCEGCTWCTTQVAELSYLHSRDITYAVFCQGPYDESSRYHDFMGWTMPWYSAEASLDSLLDGKHGSMHLICYVRDGDRVFETYWTTGRGVEAMDYSDALMDLTVYGRQEPWEDSPPGWPQPWVPETLHWRTDGRPIAQWSRLDAGRSDDLTGAPAVSARETVIDGSNRVGHQQPTALDASALPAVVDRATYQAELDSVRVREKAHTREGDAIAAARRRLPMVEVDANIELSGPPGPVTLLDAFEGHRQLIAYYFMWHSGRPAAEQCEGCTFYTTQVAELSYLHSRDIAYAVFCQGPHDESIRYHDFMGWDMPWYSAQASLDSLLAGRQVGTMYLVSYVRDGDRVFETYWTTIRGVEAMDYSYALMDLTVYGCQEPWEDSPPGWPQDWLVDGSNVRVNGRPTAQWSRLEAGRSDDLTDGR